MNLVKHILFIPFFLTCLSAFSQGKQAKDFSSKEIEKAMEQEDRMIVMQFSTDWCVYCKMQDRQLTKDKEISKLLEEKTYYINMDAESKDTLKFKNTLYSPSPYKNGLHEFTLALAGKHEEPSFPMWIILNKNHEIVYRQSGLVKTKELSYVLNMLLY